MGIREGLTLSALLTKNRDRVPAGDGRKALLRESARRLRHPECGCCGKGTRADLERFAAELQIPTPVAKQILDKECGA